MRTLRGGGAMFMAWVISACRSSGPAGMRAGVDLTDDGPDEAHEFPHDINRFAGPARHKEPHQMLQRLGAIPDPLPRDIPDAIEPPGRSLVLR